MNVQYQNTYYPPLECVNFISMHVMKKDFHSERMKDDAQLAELCVLLNQMKEEVGRVFDEHFSDCRFLFTDLTENLWSCARQIITACSDFAIADNTTIFTTMKSSIQKDPLYLLRVLCDYDLESQTDIMAFNEAELFDQIAVLNISDEYKWQLFQLHLHKDMTIKALEHILQAIDPIYQKYASVLLSYLNIYAEDRQQKYAEQDMFLHMMKLLGFQYLDDRKPVIVVPSITAAYSMALSDIRMNTQQCVVVWGVLVLRFMERENMWSLEQICTNLKILSDKSKFEILRVLSQKRSYGVQLAKHLNLSTPTISYHLQALLNAGFISVDKEENKLYYRVNKAYVTSFIEHMEQQLLG